MWHVSLNCNTIRTLNRKGTTEQRNLATKVLLGNAVSKQRMGLSTNTGKYKLPSKIKLYMIN